MTLRNEKGVRLPFKDLRSLTKPWVVVLCLLHDFGALLPLVRLSLLLVVLVRLAHHHDVLATSVIFP